jgi:MFS family permease
VNRRFAFYSARFTGYAAQTLLMAALLITASGSPGAAIGLSALMAATLIPEILFGVPAGALADRLHPGRAYIVGAALRLIPAALALVILGDARIALGIAFLAAAGNQLFNPAEMAVVREMSGPSSARPHSALVVLQYVAQGLSAVAFAPALYFMGGTGAIVGVAMIGHVVFFGFAFMAARGLDAGSPAAKVKHAPIAESFRFLMREQSARLAIVTGAIRTAVSRGVFVALPIYIHSDIGLGKEAIAFVVAPGVVGALIGVAWSARNITPATAASTMRLASVAMVVGILALAVLDYGLEAAVYMTHVGPLVRFEASLNTTFILALPAAFLLGLAFAGAIVSSRVALTAHAPEGQQARVFAVQGTATESLLILPLLLTGIGAETVGARATLGALGLVGATAVVFMELPYLAARFRVRVPSLGVTD